jgi:hypothetical protein
MKLCYIFTKYMHFEREVAFGILPIWENFKLIFCKWLNMQSRLHYICDNCMKLVSGHHNLLFRRKKIRLGLQPFIMAGVQTRFLLHFFHSTLNNFIIALILLFPIKGSTKKIIGYRLGGRGGVLDPPRGFLPGGTRV